MLPDRIAVEIGKGGDTLVPAIVGEQADERDGDGIRHDQPERFRELAQRHGLRVFPQARELLAAARRRGLQVVIATSSGRKQIDAIEQYGGWRFTADAEQVVSADDAATSKPAPDLVAAAVARAGVSPAQCVMVGDTPYDATSAAGAGVATLGVTCGGNPAEVLRRAGARRVYRDPEHLLTRLDEAVSVVSPTVAHLTRSTLDFLMGEALSAARDGLADGGWPVGAVLAGTDGNVVARGHDPSHRTGNRTLHAEMAVLAAAAGGGPWVLVTTLEPCVMCAAAATQLAVDTVAFVARDRVNGGVSRVVPPVDGPTQLPRFVGDVRAAGGLALFRHWLGAHQAEATPQVTWVRQMLAANGTP